VAADFSNLRQILLSVDAGRHAHRSDAKHRFEDLRVVATKPPDLALLPLGFSEQRRDIMRRRHNYFDSFVPRNASVEELCSAIVGAAASRLAGPVKKPSGLLRSWFEWMRHTGRSSS
jgi:hypothetical protein